MQKHVRNQRERFSPKGECILRKDNMSIGKFAESFRKAPERIRKTKRRIGKAKRRTGNARRATGRSRKARESIFTLKEIDKWLLFISMTHRLVNRRRRLF